MNNIYYKARDNTLYTKYTKQEIYNLINPYDKFTFLFLLEDMDYPFIEREWNILLKTMIRNNKDLQQILGKYIAKMRLLSFKCFGYKDGDILNEI